MNFAVPYSAILRDANMSCIRHSVCFVMGYYVGVARTLDTLLRFLCSGHQKNGLYWRFPKGHVCNPAPPGISKQCFSFKLYVLLFQTANRLLGQITINL
jgi:hypothetical protein